MRPLAFSAGRSPSIPKIPGAHAAMADLYLRQGHRKEALMHLREALSEDPKNEGARKMFEALWKGSLGQLEEPE